MRFCASGAGRKCNRQLYNFQHWAAGDRSCKVLSKKSKLVFKTGVSGWADGMLIPHLLQSRGR